MMNWRLKSRPQQTQPLNHVFCKPIRLTWIIILGILFYRDVHRFSLPLSMTRTTHGLLQQKEHSSKVVVTFGDNLQSQAASDAGVSFDLIATSKDQTLASNNFVQHHADDMLSTSTNKSEASTVSTNFVQTKRPNSSIGKRSTSNQGNFAYAYTIAGCDQHDSCVGYILNAIVASTILQHHNSTSDVILLVRMSSGINEQSLPSIQEDWLAKSGVKLQYVPKIKTDNFPTATLEKFRTLELLQYDRVRFFDADLIPLCNLDREFQDSYEGRLEGFVGRRGSVAPITACDFIVTPQRGLFDKTMNLIHSTRERTNGTWDPQVGFGHEFRPGEQWVSGARVGTEWNFYGASIDQGLLYQLFRYEIGNWSDVSTGTNMAWQETHDIPPDGVNSTNSSWALLTNGRWATLRPNNEQWQGTVCFRWNGKYPVSNFHFNGAKKPWRNSVTVEKVPLTLEDPTMASQAEFWFYWLGMANRTWDLQLPSVIKYGGEAQTNKKKRKRGNPMQYDDGKNKNVLLDPNAEIPRSFLEQLSF